jgi:hypothetical protein
MDTKVQRMRDLATGAGLIAANKELRALAETTGLRLANELVSEASALAIRPVLPRRGRLQGTGFATRVVEFNPGAGAGYNADRLDAVLGRPEGGGAFAGSYDVVTLGQGGSIVVELGREVTQGLIVFENPIVGFEEPGRVEVGIGPAGVTSSSQIEWYTLPGTAGHQPVHANRTNGIPVLLPQAGGDRFSFSDAPNLPAGAAFRYVRITDLSSGLAIAPTAGFDLDAVYGY